VCCSDAPCSAVIGICALCSIVDDVCGVDAMYSNTRGVATSGVCVQCWYWEDGSVCGTGLGHVSGQSYQYSGHT
jgi:hypothetical protein